MRNPSVSLLTAMLITAPLFALGALASEDPIEDTASCSKDVQDLVKNPDNLFGPSPDGAEDACYELAANALGCVSINSAWQSEWEFCEQVNDMGDDLAPHLVPSGPRVCQANCDPIEYSLPKVGIGSEPLYDPAPVAAYLLACRVTVGVGVLTFQVNVEPSCIVGTMESQTPLHEDDPDPIYPPDPYLDPQTPIDQWHICTWNHDLVWLGLVLVNDIPQPALC